LKEQLFLFSILSNLSKTKKIDKKKSNKKAASQQPKIEL
jgi:hypothetical protein